MKYFDPKILLRYEWPPEWKKEVEDFIAAWPDTVAKYEARQVEIRQGKVSTRDLLMENAYPNPALE